jgi:hypothetical protein
MLDTGGQVLIYDLRKANVFSIKPGINLILLFEGFPIILSICSKHELLSTSSEHDGAQLHPLLTKETMLDWNCKHEFLNHITEQITAYTYYPSCHQVYDVAKAIIQKFPFSPLSQEST